MKKGVLIIIAIATHSISFGQNAVLKIGGPESDIARAIIQTADGGFAMTGSSASYGAGQHDMFVSKISDTGELQWSKAIGGSSNETGNSLVQTSDGGFIVAGHTFSFSQYARWYIVKLNSAGDSLWTKIIGEPGIPRDVINCNDGGFAVTGGVSFQLKLTKYDENGNQEWSRRNGGFNGESGYSVVQDSEGNFVVAGFTSSFGTSGDLDVYIVKIDLEGNLLWTKHIGGPNNDWGNSIAVAQDGGYVIAGYTESFGAGDKDVYIIKLNSNGDEEWSKTIGTENDDEGQSIFTCSDNSFVISGAVELNENGITDAIYVVKMQANGTIEWARCYGDTGFYRNSTIVQTNDGGYAISSTEYGINADVILMKLDADGYGCYYISEIGEEEDVEDTIGSGDSTLDNSFDSEISGFEITDGGILSSECFSSSITENLDEEKITVYPNPFNDHIIIQTSEYMRNATVTLYNNIGQIVKCSESIFGHSFKIPRAELPEGLYLIQLTQDNKLFEAKKVIVAN